MRVTRAYIASAGTAAVMLAAALSLLALVSTYIAFGRWPGSTQSSSLSQIVLRAVSESRSPNPVTVSSRPLGHRATRSATGVTAAARRGAVRHSVVPQTRVGTHRQSAQPTSGPHSGSQLLGAVRTHGNAPSQPFQQVTKPVNDTTQQVQDQVQSGVQTVQDQVNQVVGSVTGTPPPPGGTNTSNPVTTTVTGAVSGTLQVVSGLAGAILGQ
jgi:hypothetical protein